MSKNLDAQKLELIRYIMGLSDERQLERFLQLKRTQSERVAETARELRTEGLSAMTYEEYGNRTFDFEEVHRNNPKVRANRAEIHALIRRLDIQEPIEKLLSDLNGIRS